MNNIATRSALSAWSTRARAVLRMRVKTAGRATHCFWLLQSVLELECVFIKLNTVTAVGYSQRTRLYEGNAWIETKFEHLHSSVQWHLLCACATSGARHLCKVSEVKTGCHVTCFDSRKLFSQHTWPHTLNITAFTVRPAAHDSIFRHLEDCNELLLNITDYI